MVDRMFVSCKINIKHYTAAASIVLYFSTSLCNPIIRVVPDTDYAGYPA